MNFLSIDTATERGLVVVSFDGAVGASVAWRSNGRHDESLLDYIDSALREAGVAREELGAIGVVVGPGGFTSLRVGLATAKGLALALNRPIVGMSSLRVMARSMEAAEGSIRVPVVKAYRGDVFAAAFAEADDRLRELVPPRCGAPKEILGRIRDEAGGRPLRVWDEGDVVTPEALAREALLVIRSDGPADLASLEPRYLRPSDAQLPDPPLRTRGAKP